MTQLNFKSHINNKSIKKMLQLLILVSISLLFLINGFQMPTIPTSIRRSLALSFSPVSKLFAYTHMYIYAHTNAQTISLSFTRSHTSIHTYSLPLSDTCNTHLYIHYINLLLFLPPLHVFTFLFLLARNIVLSMGPVIGLHTLPTRYVQYIHRTVV